VRAVRLEPTTVTEPIEGFGTARARQSARLSAQAADEIIEMADGLKVGSHVTAGQVLIRINHTEYRQVLTRAESLLAAAEAELGLLDVEEANLVQLLAPARRTRLQAARADHQAAVAIAKLDLERCVIRAPFDGRVAIGTTCTLSTPAVANVTWQGRAKRISPAADKLTHTFELFVEVDNTEHPRELVPGFFTHARIQGPTPQNVLVVPRGSIQQEHVYVYQDGEARRRQVQIARHLSDQAVVTGVNPGDRVITSNLDALYEGLHVRIDMAQVNK